MALRRLAPPACSYKNHMQTRFSLVDLGVWFALRDVDTVPTVEHERILEGIVGSMDLTNLHQFVLPPVKNDISLFKHLTNNRNSNFVRGWSIEASPMSMRRSFVSTNYHLKIFRNILNRSFEILDILVVVMKEPLKLTY